MRRKSREARPAILPRSLHVRHNPPINVFPPAMVVNFHAIGNCRKSKNDSLKTFTVLERIFIIVLFERYRLRRFDFLLRISYGKEQRRKSIHRIADKAVFMVLASRLEYFGGCIL